MPSVSPVPDHHHYYTNCRTTQVGEMSDACRFTGNPANQVENG
jgi:hypothetical protein